MFQRNPSLGQHCISEDHGLEVQYYFVTSYSLQTYIVMRSEVYLIKMTKT
jgi:hypothetical protein